MLLGVVGQRHRRRSQKGGGCSGLRVASPSSPTRYCSGNGRRAGQVATSLEFCHESPMVGEGDEANTAAMRGGRLPRSEKATGQAPTVAAAGADGIDDGKGMEKATGQLHHP